MSLSTMRVSGRSARRESADFVDDVRDTLRASLFGMIHVTQLVLPIFRRQGAGTIVNMSSVMGRKAFAQFGSYAIVMHAVSAFSDSLRQELAGSGIRVSVIHPALTATDLLRDVEEAEMPPPFRHMTPLSSDDVARAVVAAVKRRKRRGRVAAHGENPPARRGGVTTHRRLRRRRPDAAAHCEIVRDEPRKQLPCDDRVLEVRGVRPLDGTRCQTEAAHMIGDGSPSWPPIRRRASRRIRSARPAPGPSTAARTGTGDWSARRAALGAHARRTPVATSRLPWLGLSISPLPLNSGT